MCAVCGEGAVTDRKCLKWFAVGGVCRLAGGMEDEEDPTFEEENEEAGGGAEGR